MDFSQCSNNAFPSTATDCPGGWINGILNPNNSHYAEDNVIPQRWVLDITTAGSHTITFRYQARKGNIHAYDSLATWNYTQVTADRCQGIAPCPGGAASTFAIPDDPQVVPPAAGSAVTSVHMIPAGAGRQATMYGATITGVSVPVHDSPTCPGGNCSDDYATVTVTFNVGAVPSRVMLLLGGHAAASSGPRGWGPGLGAGNISGGPYHFKWDLLDGASVGNRDNQIQSGAIATETPTATNTPTDTPTNTP
ncbi:MAG TPA: hypothetical protein VFM49_14165, partial [Chloroflexia bacterium]|nr:hypothetical protein [Chloroflexia bacterium]